MSAVTPWQVDPIGAGVFCLGIARAPARWDSGPHPLAMGDIEDLCLLDCP